MNGRAALENKQEKEKNKKHHREGLAARNWPQRHDEDVRPAVDLGRRVAAVGRREARFAGRAPVGAAVVVDEAHRVGERREERELVAVEIAQRVPGRVIGRKRGETNKKKLSARSHRPTTALRLARARLRRAGGRGWTQPLSRC